MEEMFRIVYEVKVIRYDILEEMGTGVELSEESRKLKKWLEENISVEKEQIDKWREEWRDFMEIY